MAPSVDSSELERFARDGFIVRGAMYSSAEIAQVSSWIERLVAAPPRPGMEMPYYEDSLSEPGRRILSRIEKFADDGPFAPFVRSRRILDVVEALLGAPALLFKEKINFKLPGGGGFEPHQDIQPGWDDYAPYFLSAAIAVDDSTEENGCLELAAGHHKRGWLGERWKPLTAAQLAGVRFERHPMAAGDVAFFDCFVPHRSAPNRTATPRRNLYLTYHAAAHGEQRSRYFADKRKSFPPDHEREPGKNYVYRV
jgi:2-aminoethylphosphonate dioxygenase